MWENKSRLFLRALALLCAGLGATGASQAQPFENNGRGLEKQFNRIVDAAKKGQRTEVFEQLNAFLFAEPQLWFTATFGDKAGPELSANYTTERTNHVVALADRVFYAVDQGLTKVQAHRFEENCSLDIREEEYRILLLRRGKEPFYEVRLSDGDRFLPLWFFIYSNGGFRFLGRFPALPKGVLPLLYSAGPAPAIQEPIRPEDADKGVERARLLRRENPVYPMSARRVRVEGAVQLRATIGRDGKIREIHYISGPCVLAEAAWRAVRGWVYEPTKLQGRPIEVSTTIDVLFNLR